MGDCIVYMCFDCKHLSEECVEGGYSCCDYSENMVCGKKKDDGSCWEGAEIRMTICKASGRKCTNCRKGECIHRETVADESELSQALKVEGVK